MSFAIYEKKPFQVDPIPLGHFSIDKRGCLRCHTKDLKKVGISDTAVILIDDETMRIALRAPRDGEGSIAIKVSTVGTGSSKQPERRQMNLAGAIHQLKLEPADVAGREEFLFKDGLAILNLDTPRVDDQDEQEA